MYLSQVKEVIEIMLIKKSILPQMAQRRPLANVAKDPSTVSKVALPVVGGAAVAFPAAMWGASLGSQIQGQLYRKGFGLVQDGTVTLRQAFDALPYVNDRAMLSRTAATVLGLVGFAAGAALIWNSQRQSSNSRPH